MNETIQTNNTNNQTPNVWENVGDEVTAGFDEIEKTADENSKEVQEMLNKMDELRRNLDRGLEEIAKYRAELISIRRLLSDSQEHTAESQTPTFEPQTPEAKSRERVAETVVEDTQGQAMETATQGQIDEAQKNEKSSDAATDKWANMSFRNHPTRDYAIDGGGGLIFATEDKDDIRETYEENRRY